MPNKPLFLERGRLVQTILVLIGIVGLWFFAHYLKNLYLGTAVSYQENFTATTEVNFLLMVFSICTLRFIWKEFAFTLVELSIVLIIIGFIIAGISAGTSLIQSSRLNSVIVEVRNMQTAILNFRSRYNAIPGDMTNALQYFGSACGDGTIGGTTSCNGNGNGNIDFNYGPTLGSGPIEDLKFWQHLTLSQMLAGNFSGQIVASVRQQINVNIPASSYGKGGGYWGRNASIYGIPSTPIIQLGSYASSGALTGIYENSATTPADAYSIDIKIDDGNGASGQVIAFRGNEVWNISTSCMSGTFGALPSSYILTDPTNSCRMGFYVVTSN